MKRKYVLVIVFLFPLFYGFAQKDSVHTLAEGLQVMPEFPGGNGALLKLISDSCHFPNIESENIFGGKTIVRFIIDENGKVDSVRVVKSSVPEIDAEFVRVIKQLPVFKPGTRNGKPVKTTMVLPFTLHFR